MHFQKQVSRRKNTTAGAERRGYVNGKLFSIPVFAKIYSKICVVWNKKKKLKFERRK